MTPARRQDGGCVVGGLRAGGEAHGHAADRLGHLGEVRRKLVVPLDRDGRPAERRERPVEVRERDERVEGARLRPGGQRRLEHLGTQQPAGVDDGLAGVQPQRGRRATRRRRPGRPGRRAPRRPPGRRPPRNPVHRAPATGSARAAQGPAMRPPEPASPPGEAPRPGPGRRRPRRRCRWPVAPRGRRPRAGWAWSLACSRSPWRWVPGRRRIQLDPALLERLHLCLVLAARRSAPARGPPRPRPRRSSRAPGCPRTSARYASTTRV